MDDPVPGPSRDGPSGRPGGSASAASGSSGSLSDVGGDEAARPSGTAFREGDLVASRFRIVRFIARGGMGEVYEAQDLELHDRIALKTIRPEISGSDQALKRFRREVLLARKVTHPNVCRTFDVFRHQLRRPTAWAADGEIVAVTMELLTGETLAERLQRLGRLAPAEALPIASQMAAALDAAHAAGIVHRDFKSSNVMLLPPAAGRQTPRAVVTDFGLAQGNVGADVTLSEPGRLLGTPAYLAPEQIEGGATTPAVDVYAFGVVLFEMVTGARPFSGDTPLSTALKRLHEPAPPPRGFAPDLSDAWNAVILRCLARDPAARFPSASEAVAALGSHVGSSLGIPLAVSPAASWLRSRRKVFAAAGVALLVGLVGAVQWWRSDAPLIDRLRRGDLSLVVASQGRADHPVLSPDGRMLAYVAADANGQIDVFIGDAGGEGRIRLTNDAAREEDPNISPDGSRLVFTRLNPESPMSEIWVVPVLGGSPMLLVPRAADAAWSPDGSRIAFVHRPQPGGAMVLATASVDGTDVRTLLQADGAYLNLRSPAWSPDGQEIAFVKGRGGVSGELWTTPSGGGEPRRLSNDPEAVFSEQPVYTPDGEGIVHSSNRGGATNIWVVPRAGGAPVRLTTGPGPDEAPSIARDGTLVFGSSRWRTALLAYSVPDGASRTLVTHSRFLWAPAFSPDGEEIVYSQGEIDGSWQIWSVPLAGGETPRRLTAVAQGAVYPRFMPDGKHVVFQNWDEPRRIWQVPRSGGAPALLPIEQQPGDGYADVSPDGRSVAFVRADAEAEHVYVAPMGTGAPQRLEVGPASVPAWSPDGKWIAFSRDRSYVGGVFVVRPDGSGLRRVSQRGGWPVWWPDGSAIAYLAVGSDGNQRVEVVSADGGEPRQLDLLRYSGSNYPIAIARDRTEIVTSNGTHISDEIWVLRPATDE